MLDNTRLAPGILVLKGANAHVNSRKEYKAGTCGDLFLAEVVSSPNLPTQAIRLTDHWRLEILQRNRGSIDWAGFRSEDQDNEPRYSHSGVHLSVLGILAGTIHAHARVSRSRPYRWRRAACDSSFAHFVRCTRACGLPSANTSPPPEWHDKTAECFQFSEGNSRATTALDNGDSLGASTYCLRVSRRCS